MSITVRYLPMRKEFLDRRGLAERELRRRLERQGWTVWRGELVGILRNRDDLYLNVRKKYELLERLLEQHRPGTLERLQYLAAVHHGMPDFLCFRRGEFEFVECKLCHEQLSRVQKACIPKLQALGFTVEIHKLVDDRTKVRAALFQLETSEKTVIERQLKLTKKLMKGSSRRYAATRIISL
jgi:hypothetical protein